MKHRPRCNMVPEAGPPHPPRSNAFGRSPYHEDDDLDIGRPQAPQNPTNAGMIGFILSMASLGLVGVVLILWYAMSVENRNQENAERLRLMMYWFVILDITSFFMAVAATVFSGRGLSPMNPLYRGWSLAGLILGIFEMVVTAIAGFFLSCCVGVLELMRNIGG